MGFNRPQVKAAAKAVIRQARPSPRWITLLFFLLLWVVPGVLMLLAARPLLNLASLAAAGVSEHPLYRSAASVSGGLSSLLFFLGLLAALFCVVLTYGYLGYGLKLWRGQETSWRDLFCGIPQAGRVLLLTLQIFLFTFLWTLLGALLSSAALYLASVFVFLLAALSEGLAWLAGSLLNLGLMAGFMVFLYSRVLRYALACYILLDKPEYRAGEALDESKDLMVGHRWNFFVLLFSFLGWFLLTALIYSAGMYIAAALANHLFMRICSSYVRLTLLFWLLACLLTLPLVLWLAPYLACSCAGFYEAVAQNPGPVSGFPPRPEEYDPERRSRGGFNGEYPPRDYHGPDLPI